MTATAIEKDLVRDIGMPRAIASDAQHGRYISALLEIDRKPRPTSTEKELTEVLTILIDAYEKEHYSIHSVSGLDVLRELVDANDLRQKDLADVFGTESVVSEILSGKRPLSKNHIEKLSKRFNISPAAFFDATR